MSLCHTCRLAGAMRNAGSESAAGGARRGSLIALEYSLNLNLDPVVREQMQCGHRVSNARVE